MWPMWLVQVAGCSIRKYAEDDAYGGQVGCLVIATLLVLLFFSRKAS